MKNFFRPEFLNRIDGTVVFHPLNRSNMENIVDILMREVISNLLEKGISLEITPEAKKWLAEKGYDPTFGARPLRRLIQDTVEYKLTDEILAGNLGPADTALIGVSEDSDDIVISTQSPVSLTSSTA